MRVFESFASQQFSFPHPIINYVLKSKQSSIIYQKLIQTCKCFFVKNPVIVVDRLSASRGKYYLKTEKDGVYYSDENENGKFWICKDFSSSSEKVQISKLIRKIYKCDINWLHLQNQTITFKEYLKIIGKGSFEYISLIDVNIIFDNGAFAPLEAIIENLSNVKELFIHLPNISNHWITPQTVEKLLNFTAFDNLVDFHLENIPASFDLEAFEEFIKNHPDSKIHLWFANSLSRDDYKRLNKIRTKIIRLFNYRSFLSIVFF